MKQRIAKYEERGNKRSKKKKERTSKKYGLMIRRKGMQYSISGEKKAELIHELNKKRDNKIKKSNERRKRKKSNKQNNVIINEKVRRMKNENIKRKQI